MVSDPFFIYLFLSLLFFLALLRPQLAILACLAILPSYLLKLSIFGIPTTVLELSIYATFIGSFCSLLFFKSKNPKSEIRNPKQYQILKHQNSKLFDIWVLNLFRASTLEFRILLGGLFWPIIAWLIITVISAFFSENIQTALGGWKAWVLDPILVLILIIRFFKPTDLWKIIASLSVSSAVLSFYGLAEYFLWPGQLGDGRLDSVFDPANYHAMLVGPIIMLAIGFLFHRQTPRFWKYCLGIASAINLIALVFTFSYGGYLAVLGGLIIYGFLALNRAQKKKMIFGALIIFIIFLALASPTKKFQNIFDYKERSSGHAPLEIWQTSWLIFKEHPIIGVGLNNFEDVYRETIPRVAFPPLEWLVAQPHNLYLALLTQTGLLGLFAFLWIIIQFFKSTNRDTRNASYKLQVTSFAALSAILIHGLVDTPYFKNDLSIIFWVIIAVSIVIFKQTERNQTDQ